MTNNIVRIGVIGCGDIGSIHAGLINCPAAAVPVSPTSTRHPVKLAKRQAKKIIKKILGRPDYSTMVPAIVSEPTARVLAGCDINPQNTKEFCERFEVEHSFSDYHDLLACEEVDAVIIAVPPNLHCEIAVAAAKAGKHIFCEKPMAMTSDECTQMIDAAADAGVVLQIGYVLRYSQERGRIRQAVLNGELGRPVFWREVTNMRSGPVPQWVQDANVGGGPLYENSHALDFLLHTFGPVKSVYALNGHFKPDATTADDTLAISLMFESGDKALFTDSYALPGFGWDDVRCRGDFMQFDVAGPLGLAQFPAKDHSPVLTVYHYGSGGDEVADSMRWTSEFGADGYEREIQTFCQCVRSGHQPPIATGEDARGTIELIEAIKHSARTGKLCEFHNGQPVLTTGGTKPSKAENQPSANRKAA